MNTITYPTMKTFRVVEIDPSGADLIVIHETNIPGFKERMEKGGLVVTEIKHSEK